MKYNPKVNQRVAGLSGVTGIHPLWPEETIQPALRVLWEMERLLSEVCGMDAFSLQPSAGAQGELVGMLMIQAWHRACGHRKTTVLIPDSAHGTNPASASMCGFSVREVTSNDRGMVDLHDLTTKMDDDVAALMLTNPNTLGVFEEEILEIARIVHDRGGLLYYDGANFNACLGRCRPGDMGFDVVHLNLHKSFSTPHGGGGPGAGPVGVKRALERFLPVPRVVEEGGMFRLIDDRPESIGKVGTFYGNFGVILRAYTYIRLLGAEGLRKTSGIAVLNANYLCNKLKTCYHLPFSTQPMHEFVLSTSRQKQAGASALDIAKRLIDYGFHPPTIYFPLIVREAMMIEPTETETLSTLNAFADAMVAIHQEVEDHPQLLHQAPHTSPVGRLDEARAARHPVVRWRRRPEDTGTLG
jgi:glycine dehydrogenase subunit 2